MTVSDFQTVLELFGASPPAIVHTSGELARGQRLSAAKNGLCHALPIGQAESSVAGVKFLNSILPGEVVR